jgi:hypothetical protein
MLIQKFLAGIANMAAFSREAPDRRRNKRWWNTWITWPNHMEYIYIYNDMYIMIYIYNYIYILYAYLYTLYIVAGSLSLSLYIYNLYVFRTYMTRITKYQPESWWYMVIYLVKLTDWGWHEQENMPWLRDEQKRSWWSLAGALNIPLILGQVWLQRFLFPKITCFSIFRYRYRYPYWCKT